MRSLFITLLLSIPSFSFSQFKIIVDPTYEQKIRTAVYLIYTTNVSDYVRLASECSQIRITSDSIPNQLDDQIIKVPLRLVSAPSYNNLAAWLVNQSYYLSLGERIGYGKSTIKDSASIRHELEFTKLLKPETKKSMRQLKKDSKLYWENNPYENHNPQEKDTTVTETQEIKIIEKKSCIFLRIFKKKN